jgi:hypothetical protein
MCTATATKTVTYSATLPVINIMGSATFCANRVNTIMASPGFASYAWSTGASIRQITTPTAGTYIVTVTAVNGCSTTRAITVAITPLPTISLAPVTTVCVGNPMSIVATVTGATGNVTWLCPNSITLTTPVLTPTLTRTATTAIAGTYIARATNACGTRSVSTAAQVRNVMPITVAVQNASILGGNTGYINVTAAAGSSFLWNTGQTTNYLRNLPVGATRTIVVTPPASGPSMNYCPATRLITVN